MIEILAHPRHYRKVTEARPVDLIVLHSMESQEKPGTARQVAKWFATDRPTLSSAHYCVDDSEVVLCVSEHNIAYAAPGANRNGIHVELAGKASQSEVEWMDGYSLNMFAVVIPLLADICRRCLIPAQLVDANGLIHGLRGITTHAAVSEAFKKSSHWDPGPNFPLRALIGKVAAELRRT